MHHIIPYIDYGIDFHTGGAQRTNYPQIRGDFQDPEMLKLAQSTHAPFLIHSGMIPGSFRMEAFSKGKRIIVYEGGESLRFDKFAISEGVNCAHRLLHSFGMSGQMPEPCLSSTQISETTWYRCPDSGMWIPTIEYGDFVEKGHSLGFMTSPYGDFKTELLADRDGYIIGLNNQAVVNKGDALINLGTLRTA